MKKFTLFIGLLLLAIALPTTQAWAVSHVSMTTKVAPGAKIKLRVDAAGAITIGGVTNPGDYVKGKEIEYELKDSKITIDGDMDSLWCYNIQLTEIDVTQAPTLGRLYCYGNQLKTLDVSKNAKLRYLNCSNSTLESINLNGAVVLDGLYCYGNKLTSLRKFN